MAEFYRNTWSGQRIIKNFRGHRWLIKNLKHSSKFTFRISCSHLLSASSKTFKSKFFAHLIELVKT
jgi:hypothetical protein